MSDTDDDNEILNTAGVAALTTLSESQIRKLAAAGEIPSFRFGPKLLRFRRADVLAWIDDRLIPNGK